MPYGSVNADLMTTSDGVSSSGLYGFKNRIINGAMVIDQRNAGASLAISSIWQYSVDRFNGSVYSGGTGRYSLQQSTTVPAGFTNSLKMTVTTADASPSADYGYALQQVVEGLNCTDLNWGSANATTVTLSFWVYSSVTGNLPVVLLNSGNARYYATTYSVASANTWTKISLTIVGDTSGTWLTTSAGGIYINFGFGAGSNRTASTANAWATSAYGGNLTSVTGATSVIATNGATFYITGVQLEKGATATAFDYRPYASEYFMCCRYFRYWGFSSAFESQTDSSSNHVTWQFPQPMRTLPTLVRIGNLITGRENGSSVIPYQYDASSGSASGTECYIFAANSVGGTTPVAIGGRGSATAEL